MEETPSPSLFPNPLTESVYRGLANIATRETSFHSSISTMIKNPHVQEIIKLGIDVLPLVFDDLQNGNSGCHWRMGVVREILESHGLPPVEIPDEFCGKVKEMVRIYGEYGRDQGYI